MLFHSYVFLFVFLPLTWGIFLAFKRRGLGRAAAFWLLLSSLFFYGWWNPRFLLLVLASVGGNYAFGLLLGWPGLRARFAALWGGLAYNLGILGYFKYAGFLTEVWNQLSGAQTPVPAILLPLAISFYTFQQISYIVDTYRTREPERDLLNYCLFIVFFPHLIAGPITHHTRIIPQFRNFYDTQVKGIDIAVGFSLIAVGLGKKVGIADQVGAYFVEAYPLIAQGATLGFFESWSVMTACALQIYFDYSGYADMAAGIGLLFGVRMPLNFFSPYKATSPVEFWRRWNMTLMNFLRSYVYIPLGGSRHGELRKYAASMSVMLVCGIWHGAGWAYIVWGLWVGSILIVNNLWNQYLPLKPPQGAFATWRRRIGGRALTYVCYLLPLTIFMFPTLEMGGGVLKSMLGGNGLSLPQGFATILAPLSALGFSFAPAPGFQGMEMALTIFGAFCVLYLCPNSEQLFARYQPTQHNLPPEQLRIEGLVPAWRPSVPAAVLVALLAGVCLMFLHHVREFFYFQF